MIYNEEAYYTGYYRNVRAIKAVPALVFDTIVGLLRDPNNKTGEIANKTLQDMLGVSKQTVLDAINKIIEVGWIVRTNGDGRGNKSVYALTEKGLKNVPFMDKKGSNNWTERVKKLDYKGQEIRPINKELNKELKEREETPTPTKVVMEDFEKWWNLFPGDPDFSYDKENCERVWFGMPAEWKAKLVEMAEHGTRWRNRNNDKPIFYLRDYQGQDEQVELPYWRQGTAEHTKRLNEADTNGETIIIMRYDGHLAFCLEKDRDRMEAAGAEFVTVREKRKCE